MVTTEIKQEMPLKMKCSNLVDKHYFLYLFGVLNISRKPAGNVSDGKLWLNHQFRIKNNRAINSLTFIDIIFCRHLK